MARNARQLADRPVLSGWLHRTTQNLAANTVRSDVRRRAHEQEAAAMNELFATEPDAVWEQIGPHLDAALGELSEADRDALLLRYFERKSAREMAQTLGTSEEAAQKRVSRAVERLREFFAKRGVTVGASGLVVVISANAIQAAPVGLAATISTAVALAGTTVATTATTIAMTTLQKTLITGTIAAAVGTGIFEVRQASSLRSQVQTLQQRLAPLAEQIQRLQTERDEAMKQLAASKDQNEHSNTNSGELLRLRGQTVTLRSSLAAMKSDYEKLVSESVRGQFRPRTDWSDKGNQDPFTAVETMLWAFSQKQQARLQDVATPQALLDTRSPIFPREHPPIQSVGAVNLINTTQNQEGTRAVVTAFVREDFIAPPGGTPYSLNNLLGWQLIKSNEGWKVSKMLFFDLGHD